MRRPYIAAVAIAVLLCPLAARAQPLADRVPADAIVYLGWAGAQTPVPGYAGSHLQVVIDNSKIPELGSRFLPQIFQKFAEKEPDAAEPLRIAQALWATTWKHPTALFFAGVDTSDPKNIAPRLGFICSAGADSAAMKKEIDDLLVAAANAPFPVRAVDADGLVGVVVGYDDPAKALASQGGGAIAKAAGFASAMKQVQAEPVLIAYVDFEKLINMAESHVQAEADEHTKQMVPKVIDALGIRGLKRVICTAGFDGQDWMTQTFVEAPAPRKGMLAMFDGKPVSPELLKAIPADATFVATGRFDPAKLVNTVRAVAAEIDPHLAQMIDQGLGAAQLALAKNLVTEIFEPLGEDWALYCSPSIAGNGVLGVVVVNRLDDPAKAQASLPTAAINLSNWLGVVMKETEAEVEIRGRLTKIDDLDIYYVGLPIVAPSWAIKDGFLYMGLYTQPVASAARWTGSGGKSIADNARFAALQKRLNVSNPCSFSFYDLQTTAQGSTYQQLMLLARYGGFGDLFGVPLPEPLLPTLDVLAKQLSPAGSAAWIDDAGYHEKGISPFPGSRMLSEPGMFSGAGGVGGGAVAVGILLPSLNRARETANRVKCASNERRIGQAILLYSNDNRGQYPPDLGTLLLTQDTTAEVFFCPSVTAGPPSETGNMQPQELAKWINENASYVYLGAGLNNSVGADTVVLYERPEDHDQDGVNVLFGDGHVEFLLMEDAMERIPDLADAVRRRR